MPSKRSFTFVKFLLISLSEYFVTKLPLNVSPLIDHARILTKMDKRDQQNLLTKDLVDFLMR